MVDKVKELQKVVVSKQNKINALLEVTKAVNNNFSRAALLRIFEFVLRSQLEVDKMLLFVYFEGWEKVIDVGKTSKANEIDVERDLTSFQIIQNVSNFPNEVFKDFELLIPIIHKSSALAYLLLGKIKVEQTESKEDNINFIKTIANFILVSLENKRLFTQKLKQERLDKEMELAAKVQGMLIPKVFDHPDNVQVAGHYQPHGSIGGDYYDFIKIDDNNIAICMCDISGKGLAAGMLMANFQANLRALIIKKFPLEQLVDHLNFKLKDTTAGDKYITMFVGMLNLDTRKFSYVNAGHNPPLLINNGDSELLKKGCTILGVFDSLPSIEAQEITLEENSLLVTYTDGLTELENDFDEMYELDRLTKFSIENEHLKAQDFVDKLIAELHSFKGDNDYNDDISLLVCRF